MDYEYKGLMAQLWDILRGDTSQWPDRSFYREVIGQYGQPVLDVGCGTGRLLLDYAAQGLAIEGVDNSPDMLALCRQKAAGLGLAVTVYRQDMLDLDLPRRYRTILVPSSSLQLVLEAGAAQQAVQRLAAHLEPGGGLAASFMTLWKAGDPLESQVEKQAEGPDGTVFRRRAWARFDPDRGLEHTEDTYQVLRDGVVVAEETHRRSPATLSYTQAQARALFEGAGLERVRVLHEFTFAPARPEDTLFVLLGEKG